MLEGQWQIKVGKKSKQYILYLYRFHVNLHQFLQKVRLNVPENVKWHNHKGIRNVKIVYPFRMYVSVLLK